MSFLTQPNSSVSQFSEYQRETLIGRARTIDTRMGEIRYSDVVPRDEEAEAHAREHLALEKNTIYDDDDIVTMSEEGKARRDIERFP